MNLRLQDKLLDKVRRDPKTGCWVWMGARLPTGYGRMYAPGVTGSGMTYPHRISYALFCGDPSGLLVCHRCDNPPCCNPSHLFLGTDADNHRDRNEKGRFHSDRNEKGRFHSKINCRQADLIRGKYHSGKMTQAALALQFGLSQPQVSKIVNGKRWLRIPAH